MGSALFATLGQSYPMVQKATATMKNQLRTFKTWTENEQNRKVIEKTRDLVKTTLDIVKYELVEIFKANLKIVLYCFVFGLIIGCFISKKSTLKSLPHNTLSFPIPDGFSQELTSQDDTNLLRHFFLTRSRNVLVNEGGHVDAFVSQKTISQSKQIDAQLFMKNYTLKSRPILLKDYANNWKVRNGEYCEQVV